MAENAGTVEWNRAGEKVQATIDIDGEWSSDADGVADMLNTQYGQDRYGPADGYPAWAAIADVAKDIDGDIVDLRDLGDTEDLVY